MQRLACPGSQFCAVQSGCPVPVQGKKIGSTLFQYLGTTVLLHGCPVQGKKIGSTLFQYLGTKKGANHRFYLFDYKIASYSSSSS